MRTLLLGLKLLPPDWQLVPVSGKQPLGGKNWNKHPHTSEQLRQWLSVGRHRQRACTGFGLLTGTPVDESGNFVLAVDQDGETAQQVLTQLSQGQLPDTVAFTSLRPGRCQRLYKVPQNIAPTLRSRKIEGGVELRWAGLMSVLPPSIHPITHKPYSWLTGCSPSEREIAFAPEWLIQLMTKTPTQTRPRATVRSEFTHTLTAVTEEDAGTRGHRDAGRGRGDTLEDTETWGHGDTENCSTTLTASPSLPFSVSSSLTASSSLTPSPRPPKPPLFLNHSTIERLLTRLHPHRADDYQDWIRVGMALYSHSSSLLSLWDAWSRQSPKYKPGECACKWHTFNPTRISIGTLYYLAKVDSGGIAAS